jgi:REP element-mobilizing transposase RayT
MSTYTQIIYHIVYSTKGRVPCIAADRRKDLYNYMWGCIRNKDCHLYRIGGVEDHVHILSSLHPSIALADYIKDLKVSATKWIRETGLIARFPGWQVGYAAFTQSRAELNGLIEYIKRQETHHRKTSFREELKRLLEEAGIEFEEKYLE